MSPPPDGNSAWSWVAPARARLAESTSTAIKTTSAAILSAHSWVLASSQSASEAVDEMQVYANTQSITAIRQARAAANTTAQTR